MNKNKWFLNGGRGSGQTYRLLFEYYENKVADLEKENAELKADNREWEKASDKWKSVYELTNNQLTKAKEIIKKFLLWENAWHNKTESKYELLKQAEQFISEVEK